MPYGTRIEVSFIKAVTKDVADGSISGSIVIFDAVGNTVYKSSEMSKETNKNVPKLFLNWDGKTTKGINAGAGTYVARILITDHTTGVTTTLRQVIGVQK